MHLGHLGVAVADRVGQRGRRPGPPEQDQIRLGRRSPVPVVAGEQDFVALRVDGFHPELPTGDRQGARQPGREAARHVLDDMRRKDVAEQLAPRRVGPGEGDDGLLAAVDRLHAGDQVVAGRIDYAGLTDHLTPQVPEVVGGDRRVVGPLGFRTDLVGHRERALIGHLGRGQQGGVQLPPRAGRRARISDRTESAGQHQRTDRGVDRGQIGQQMRVEPGADRVDAHDDLRLALRGRSCAAFGLGALRRRGRADGAAGERHQQNQHAA